MRNPLSYALNTGCQLANIGKDFNHLKSNFADSAEDATRAIRKTRRATEDFLDEVASVAKKQPWTSAGIVFGVGVGFGALVGWLGARK